MYIVRRFSYAYNSPKYELILPRTWLNKVILRIANYFLLRLFFLVNELNEGYFPILRIDLYYYYFFLTIFFTIAMILIVRSVNSTKYLLNFTSKFFVIFKSPTIVRPTTMICCPTHLLLWFSFFLFSCS